MVAIVSARQGKKRAGCTSSNEAGGDERGDEEREEDHGCSGS
jgi:hypothetical protein